MAKKNADNSSFLPNRLSKAIDHWGYYNGATKNENGYLNIPKTSLVNHFYEYTTEGDSDRETNPNTVLYGVLDSVIYPTGGFTSFKFEANSYESIGTVEEKVLDLENCMQYAPWFVCCDGFPIVEELSLTSEQIEHSVFQLSLEATPLGITDTENCYAGGRVRSTVTIEVDKISGSSEGGSETIVIWNVRPATKMVEYPLADLGLEDGGRYVFRLLVENGRGAFKVTSKLPNQKILSYVGGGACYGG
jgi:hypothetical protein